MVLWSKNKKKSQTPTGTKTSVLKLSLNDTRRLWSSCWLVVMDWWFSNCGMRIVSGTYNVLENMFCTLYTGLGWTVVFGEMRIYVVGTQHVSTSGPGPKSGPLCNYIWPVKLGRDFVPVLNFGAPGGTQSKVLPVSLDWCHQRRKLWIIFIKNVSRGDSSSDRFRVFLLNIQRI